MMVIYGICAKGRIKRHSQIQRYGHVYAPLIEESLKGGIDSGVEGTPTFFINGVRYEDSFDLKTFSETIQKYLSTQEQ